MNEKTLDSRQKHAGMTPKGIEAPLHGNFNLIFQNWIFVGIWCLVIGYFVTGCSSSAPPYPADYPLTTDVFHSRQNLCTGRIPQGWFSAAEDTLAPSLLGWIVKQDYSSSLTLKELHIDRITAKRIDKEGLKLLANISMAFEPEGQGAGTVSVQPKEFSIAGRDYCGYELTTGTDCKRIVVFYAKGRYYESIAAPLKGIGSEDSAKIFSAQEVFLAGLAF